MDLPEAEVLHIYTDGSCSGNPGPGGWGVWIERPNSDCAGASLSGGDPATTNNRMELQAIVAALAELLKRDRRYQTLLFSDSEYAIRGITEWFAAWQRRNFRKVKNVDLWLKIDELKHRYERRHNAPITWQWVRGHAGNRGNEIANTLAQSAAARARRQPRPAAPPPAQTLCPPPQ